MALIQIPFREQFYKQILSGEKTATTRTKKFGEIEDYFLIAGHRFDLKFVSHVPLKYVAAIMYKEEGFKAPEDFMAIWKEIHPRKGFVPDQKVWLHIFKEAIYVGK